MREPGRLLLSLNESELTIERLADLLDFSSKSNFYKVLYALLGKDKFLEFLDVYQEDSVEVVSVQYVLKRLVYLHIYSDRERGMSVQDIAKKYKRKPDTVERIIEAVASELDKENGI